jgi:hypothetical protein
MELLKVLEIMYPTALYVLRGNEYEGLEWMDESPKPTKAQLESDAAQAEIVLAQQEQFKLAAKDSVIDKLEALGLTVNEVEVVFGLSK